MNEYLETLRIEAAQGNAESAARLAELEKKLKQQRESAQRYASKLRSEGVDVTYLDNEVGGIAFDMPRRNGRSPSTKTNSAKSNDGEEEMPWDFGGVGGGAGFDVSPDGVTPRVGVGVGVGRAWVHRDGDRQQDTTHSEGEGMSETTADKHPQNTARAGTSSRSSKRESRDERIKRLRRQSRQRKGAVGEAPRDRYIQQQDGIHNAVSKAAGILHLFIGAALSFVRTFFQRSMLTLVALFVLVTGIALAMESYCISSEALPPIIPKPGVSFDLARVNLQQVLETYNFWDWTWVAILSGFALLVQILQWASVRFFTTRVAVGRNGTNLALKGFHLLVFGVFCAALWYQDLSIVSGLYLANGFSFGGFIVWAWSAFPSEFSESIFALQKSLPEVD